jgi:hypothetical protein
MAAGASGNNRGAYLRGAATVKKADAALQKALQGLSQQS